MGMLGRKRKHYGLMGLNFTWIVTFLRGILLSVHGTTKLYSIIQLLLFCNGGSEHSSITQLISRSFTCFRLWYLRSLWLWLWRLFVFWNITPSGLVDIYQLFMGDPFATILLIWRIKWHVPLETSVNTTRLHDVTSQTTIIFVSLFLQRRFQ